MRIFNLLREAARKYDIFLFAFTETDGPVEPGPVLEFCAKVVLVPKPRYREPRWSSLAPPEVCEYRSPVMRRLLAQMRREYSIQLTQVEYTQLAAYGGDVLVEHDVTFDLYQQVHQNAALLSVLVGPGALAPLRAQGAGPLPARGVHVTEGRRVVGGSTRPRDR